MEPANVLLTAIEGAVQGEVRLALDSECVAYISASRSGATVTLHSGHEYDISLADAAGLVAAPSAGRYFNEHIKGRVG
jgi:hypothetical protein